MGPVRRHTSSATRWGQSRRSISDRAADTLDRAWVAGRFRKNIVPLIIVKEISMKTYTPGAVLAVLLGFSSLAQAGQLLSPPLPTRTRETNVTTRGTCRIFNTGTRALSVKVAVISNNDNVLDIDSCNTAPLGAGHSCIVAAHLPDDSYAACKLTGDVATIRGTFELSEEPGFETFVAVDLQ